VPDSRHLLDLFVVNVTDMRACLDAQRRTIGHIQTIVEKCRLTAGGGSLADLEEKMRQLRDSASAMTDSIAEADRVLALITQASEASPAAGSPGPSSPAASSEPSGV
jgi:hypothetical protein